MAKPRSTAAALMRELFPQAFGFERPPGWWGLLVAAVAVALATAGIYPLKHVAPVVSLSVVYLPAVLLISVYWGLALGLLTSLASAAAFNFFHIPPVGRFTIADTRNWVALAAFVLVAAVVSVIAELARSRALDAERRRREAGLVASLARELLGGADTRAALRTTARRVSEALLISAASIEPGAVEPKGRLALPLRSRDGQQIATLLVRSDLAAATVERLKADVVPPLEALVALGFHRDRVQAEAVETAALRRSNDLKTALLRSVSHDLRSPVTAIVTAGHALTSRELPEDDRRELSAAVVEEGERLAALIDKLLDLSRLQAGQSESHVEWISIEEVLLAAREARAVAGADVRVTVDPNLPPIRADAVQLGQVFSNLLENAWRYSGARPVSVRARRAGGRLIVRIVDQGPGIAEPEQERIFEPFYRGRRSGERGWKGSGLGLAIAKGFVEANGGTIAVESLPGQGSSFIVELPISQASEATVA